MVATITRRTYRHDTPERWTKALARASSEGVTVRQLAGSGAWIATSGTDADTAYVVTVRDCECRAGCEGDPVCKHRAALRAKLGLLSPEPPRPAGTRWDTGARPAGSEGLTLDEIASLRADAMKQYLFHGAPLISPFTGEIVAPSR